MAVVRALRTSAGFLSGIIVGCLLTYYCLFTLNSSKSSATRSSFPDHESILSKDSFSNQVTREDDLPSSAEEVAWPVHENLNRKNEDDSIASKLKNKVRILCWVMTSPQTIATRAIHVNATWGRRCNTLLFMSSKSNEPVPNNLSLPIIELNVAEGRSNLWEKTKAAFRYINRHHLRDAEWFLKADDDTFAVMENLRYLLKDQLPHAPVYLGRRFKRYADQGYMSGGAGYVLSRAAVKKFATVLIHTPDLCPDIYFGVEDVLIGVCLEKCGVKAMDTRDVVGRQRFHPLPPWDHLMVDYLPKDFWIYDLDYYPFESGPECCSDYTITFHYIPYYVMYVVDFLTYHVKPYGITTNCELLEDE